MPASLKKVWEHPDVASTNIESFRRLANAKYDENLRKYKTEAGPRSEFHY